MLKIGGAFALPSIGVKKALNFISDLCAPHSGRIYGGDGGQLPPPIQNKSEISLKSRKFWSWKFN